LRFAATYGTVRPEGAVCGAGRTLLDRRSHLMWKKIVRLSG